jgi:glutamate synthase (ferredoxin)
MVAEDVRAILAALGLRSVEELVGRTDLLRPRQSEAAMRLDLDSFIGPPSRRRCSGATSPKLAARAEAGRLPTLNERLLERTRNHMASGVTIRELIRNTDRAVGAAGSGAIASKFGDGGLRSSTIRVELTGSAGQSLGAFGVPGLEISVIGDANDGVAKGLCGGTVSIAPPPDSAMENPVLVGNAALYGATGGRLFVAGAAGERFAVRNSGATAVVEGVGHHGCEYMTNGTVVILGAIGFNFAAGMTGGVVFAYDPDQMLDSRLNSELAAAGGLSDEEAAMLRQLLIDHRTATRSRLAARLLARWPESLLSFCRVAAKGDNAIAARPVAEPARLRA